MFRKRGNDVFPGSATAGSVNEAPIPEAHAAITCHFQDESFTPCTKATSTPLI